MEAQLTSLTTKDTDSIQQELRGLSMSRLKKLQTALESEIKRKTACQFALELLEQNGLAPGDLVSYHQQEQVDIQDLLFDMRSLV